MAKAPNMTPKHVCGEVILDGVEAGIAKDHDCRNEATRISHVYEGISVYVCDIDHGGFFEPWLENTIYPIPPEETK